MRAALLSLFMAATAVTIPAQAADKVYPIEAFEAETIPLYSPEGKYLEDASAESLGKPQKVAVFGFDDRGFAILEHDGERVIVDPAYIELKDEFKKKALVKCAAVNKEKDNQYATSMGFGDCK